ncbi:metal ABC transporter ATP-binding protein [Waterburya agarophytonicola K14]|uniref:Metal ABC transporter ATP-binding protein n=1 Tax=Waterburya agarophytonicola KI4 TaxID=2874699 RepID=A0A964FED0_9CYAN|nr:metal ABC transporter ATP-binding protein [Waterburya agarophytonicola]MCC0175737.1 metal ABC transporter ATP-binding protein [Waterburya agarophytonicola KI4]
MLEVRNLSVSYRHTWAVERVSFVLQPGQVAGLLGSNGAGKSSLIKAILGLIPCASGAIYWKNKPVTKQLNKVAYVSQRSQIDWDYPVTVEKVAMMGRISSTGWFRSHSKHSHLLVRQALERVGMWQYRASQIRELSGGQQQRVFLARAIAQDAELFLFDEPFNNVDSQTESIIFDIFAELKAQQKALLVISHDLSETLENYDKLLLLNKKLIAAGSIETVLTNENINKAYNRYLPVGNSDQRGFPSLPLLTNQKTPELQKSTRC